MRLDQNPDSEDGNRVGVAERSMAESTPEALPESIVDVSVEGISMPVHVEVHGPLDGSRILVLHGWGASTEHMRGLINHLKPDHRVAAVDFPGHGRSPAPAHGYGMEGHLDVVDAVLEHLGWSVFSVIGHSNGGRAAISWAATRAGSRRVTSMTLIAPSGIRRRRTAAYYVRSWTARILKAPFQVLPGPIRRAGLDWLRHSLFWRMLGSSDYRSLEGPMRETFVRTVNHYVSDLLPDVPCPVLLIRGDADHAITHEQLATMQAGLTDAGLYTIPNAGHFVQEERPDVIAEAVRTLISK